MTDSTESASADDFRHHCEDCLKMIQLNRHETVEDLQNELSDAQKASLNVTARKALLDEYNRLHKGIIDRLKPELETTPDPEIIFKRALLSLDRLERFRFVVHNLLDAVKEDQSLNNRLMIYRDLGLIGQEWKDG